MARKGKDGWLQLANECARLWIDSAYVIQVRSLDILTGHATVDETTRMVTEKIDAGAELAGKLVREGSLSPRKNAMTAVTHYRKRVSANRRRLSRKRAS